MYYAPRSSDADRLDVARSLHLLAFNVLSTTKRQGCLLIFFTNFLALTIKAEVTSPDSHAGTAYSVVLVIANVCFFLAAFSNMWLADKDVIANRYIPVRAYQRFCGFLYCTILSLLPYVHAFRCARHSTRRRTYSKKYCTTTAADRSVVELAISFAKL